MSYRGKVLSLKDLLLITGRIGKRPLTTAFSVTALTCLYWVSFEAMAANVLVFMYPNQVAILVLGVSAWVFYLCLLVDWVMGIVVSVIEETSSGKAIERGEALAKGNRLHGFLINLCFDLVVLIIFQGYRIINKGLLDVTAYGVLVVMLISPLKIILLVSYTILYFHCKEHHGKEIKLHGSVLCADLLTT